MSLTCNHEADDYDDPAWWYVMADEHNPLATKRSRKCCSCGEKIKPGELAIKYNRTRNPRSDIELRIYGDDWDSVPLASWYLCEPCGDLALNLKELGYCTPPGDDMRDLVKEYADMQRDAA